LAGVSEELSQSSLEEEKIVQFILFCWCIMFPSILDGLRFQKKRKNYIISS
jgi:hypothetical protein